MVRFWRLQPFVAGLTKGFRVLHEIRHPLQTPVKSDAISHLVTVRRFHSAEGLKKLPFRAYKPCQAGLKLTNFAISINLAALGVTLGFH